MPIPPSPFPGAQLRWVPKTRPNTPKIAPAKKATAPSAASLRLVTEALLGEAFATDDPALRSRLLNRAGRVDMRVHALDNTERAKRMPQVKTEVNRLLAELKTTDAQAS